MTAPYAAVVGWPAAHSLSPLMMQTWLDAAGLPGRYGVQEIPPDRFQAFLGAAPSLGLCGMNVTLPHKEAALAHADHASEAARQIGAANLLTFTAQGLFAHNTDIEGVAAALGSTPAPGPAVLIGAGGAARAALHHLKCLDQEIRIVNRTRTRAEQLAADAGVKAEIHESTDTALAGAAVVINATSLGMAGQPALTPDFSACAAGALAFDMVYAPLRTGFLAAASASGLRTVDGLTMLIGQARPSFEAFFGAAPPGDDGVRAVLETRLGAAP